MEKSVENIRGDIKMDDVEYHLKNYGDQEGFSSAWADNTLRDLHNSSDDAKAEFNNCFIIHSK